MDFTKLGITNQDGLLVCLCPLLAALGSMANSIMRNYNDFDKVPHVIIPLSEVKSFFWRTVCRLLFFADWVAGRMFVSGILGLVFALYFVGSLVESPATVARVLAFSILLGYAAPRLWTSQERIVSNMVEKHLKEYLASQKATDNALPVSRNSATDSGTAD